MARCLEIAVASESVFSVVGVLQYWEEIKNSAAKVERVRGIDGLRDWGAMYRVQPASGPIRHYIVTDE